MKLSCDHMSLNLCLLKFFHVFLYEMFLNWTWSYHCNRVSLQLWQDVLPWRRCHACSLYTSYHTPAIYKEKNLQQLSLQHLKHHQISAFQVGTQPPHFVTTDLVRIRHMSNSSQRLFTCIYPYKDNNNGDGNNNYGNYDIYCNDG